MANEFQKDDVLKVLTPSKNNVGVVKLKIRIKIINIKYQILINIKFKFGGEEANAPVHRFI